MRFVFPANACKVPVRMKSFNSTQRCLGRYDFVEQSNRPRNMRLRSIVSFSGLRDWNIESSPRNRGPFLFDRDQGRRGIVCRELSYQGLQKRAGLTAVSATGRRGEARRSTPGDSHVMRASSDLGTERTPPSTASGSVPSTSKLRNSIVEYGKGSDRYRTEDLKFDWDFEPELDPALEAKDTDGAEGGYCYVWGATVSDFWVNYGCTREGDIRTLVALGENYPHLRDLVLLSKGVHRLRTLLPDAYVPIMVERLPECLCVDFVHASHLLIQMQAFLEADEISTATGIFERYPKLLFAESIPSAVEAAAEALRAIAPHVKRDPVSIVRDYPELIYRIHSYDVFALLPLDIQNMLLSPEDEFADAQDEWDKQWEQWGDADDGMQLDAWFDGGGEEDEE